MKGFAACLGRLQITSGDVSCIIKMDHRYKKKWSDSDTINNSISLKLMFEKYGFDPYPWTKETISRARSKTLSKNYITYPYFEKDIENLAEKNYLI